MTRRHNAAPNAPQNVKRLRGIVFFAVFAGAERSAPSGLSGHAVAEKHPLRARRVAGKADGRGGTSLHALDNCVRVMIKLKNAQSARIRRARQNNGIFI